VEGFTTKDQMEHILKQTLFVATKNISFKLGVGPSLDDLIQFMLHFKICYEKKLGKLDDGFFILAILDAKLCFPKIIMIFVGKWKLNWPKPTYQAP
jgi:hypothetical protein